MQVLLLPLQMRANPLLARLVRQKLLAGGGDDDGHNSQGRICSTYYLSGFNLGIRTMQYFCMPRNVYSRCELRAVRMKRI